LASRLRLTIDGRAIAARNARSYPTLDPGENVVRIAAAMTLSDAFEPNRCRMRKTPELHFEMTGKLPQGCVLDSTQTPNVCFFEQRPTAVGLFCLQGLP